MTAYETGSMCSCVDVMNALLMCITIACVWQARVICLLLCTADGLDAVFFKYPHLHLWDALATSSITAAM